MSESASVITHRQTSAYASPWSTKQRLALLLWSLVWPLACAWTPKPFNRWRLAVLRCFGTTVEGNPFVHPGARIQQPWNLRLRDRACLGDGACAYSLGPIDIGPGATVAQEVYLCTGTHDFSVEHLPLQTAPIVVEADAFIGVRALILPGVTIGARAVVGAGSVVTRSVPPGMIAAGNPARVLRPRD